MGSLLLSLSCPPRCCDRTSLQCVPLSLLSCCISSRDMFASVPQLLTLSACPCARLEVLESRRVFRLEGPHSVDWLVNCMFMSQSSPLPLDSLISWSCTCDFHILTLDFTLALPISWHWILPLWSPCTDFGLDHDEFSVSMMVDGTLPTLPSVRTLHFAILADELSPLEVTLRILCLTSHMGSDHDWFLTCFVYSSSGNFESNLYTWHCIWHFTLIPWHDIVIMKCMSHSYVGPWLHMPSSPLPHVSCLLYLMLCTSSRLHVNFRLRLLWWYCLLHWPWVVFIVLLHFTLISCHDIGNHMMMILVCIDLPDWHSVYMWFTFDSWLVLLHALTGMGKAVPFQREPQIRSEGTRPSLRKSLIFWPLHDASWQLLIEILGLQPFYHE